MILKYSKQCPLDILHLQLPTFCRQMLFQSFYFLPQPFCSSAHTFHGTTRSHQAGSCHRAPSKDDDFNFLGYTFQMPENTESKKISHSDNHSADKRANLILPLVTGKGNCFKICFVYLWFRNIFPENMLTKSLRPLIQS